MNTFFSTFLAFLGIIFSIVFFKGFFETGFKETGFKHGIHYYVVMYKDNFLSLCNNEEFLFSSRVNTKFPFNPFDPDMAPTYRRQVIARLGVIFKDTDHVI